ncbi:kinesin-like protein KIN-12D isoform X2 [Andrographis paniculata]|uniref:kinesin-like protein KIN-12D isoform X2 n=1 Tax=Andrographis paniculata TaxID=175694 RepID=UPI0021E78EB2|nr:kinesin-like protein KIN-12D isoform X2 [Andrographis paniculata]
MLRDFKFLRRNSGKSSNAEEAENVPINPSDSSTPYIATDPSRPPLNAIQEPSRIPRAIPEPSKKVDPAPLVKPKRKYSDTSMGLRTPEKQGISKNRFSWGHRTEYPPANAAAADAKEEGRVASVTNTPTSNRMGSRANQAYSECNSTQSTPSKSVNKPPNPGLCLASGSRTVPSGGGSRMPNYAALSKGASSSGNPSIVVNTVEVPYFELKEDPSFWLEHNVQVLIRIRPLNNMEKSSFGYNRCLKQESPHSLTWIGHPETRFMFDHVACEAIDQDTLFRMVGLPMVENCLSGYNSCMFAYGQTGSGKTYTMLGEIEELEVKPSSNRGMTPRIFEFLFARIRAEEESRRDERLKYYCKCSFLEIYNEQITDLLEPSATNLMLREDMQKGVYVEDLSEFEVHSVGDIVQLLTQGSSNRKVAATNMNRESSRSHSVFTCVIESRWEKDSTTNFRFARLNLVDLAGSERQKTSGAEGERLKEAANINKSLSTLGHVIMVLVDVANGKPRHVPYRDSRLTFLLQDSLGGNSKTVIVANISPSICSAAETLNTLKFAQRAKLIQNNAVINEDSSGDIVALKRQIQLLKEELSAIKREKVFRSLSFERPAITDTRNKGFDDCNERTFEEDQPLVFGKEHHGVVRVSSKQLKSLETTVAGSLRREQMAESTIKQLEAEIEHLNRLVSQREEDTRCTKMMLKFREDKIQRMEAVLGGTMSADAYLLKENSALTEEIELLRARIEKNPEVTRFALENIRLLEQVRRFQDMYDDGERDLLLNEISELRKQLIVVLDGNSKHPPNQHEAKGSRSNHEEFHNSSFHKELTKALSELEESKNKLSCCLEDNAKLRRELKELRDASLSAVASANQDHDCSAEVIKESIVEVPSFSNPEKMAIPQEDRGAAYGDHKTKNLPKHAEEIMDLQLELDILKVILQEEKTYRAEAEEMVNSVNRELQLSKEKIMDITKQHEKVQEELRNTKLIFEALESQHIQAINEIEDLKNSKDRFEGLLNEKELEISKLKEQSDLSLCRTLASQDSPLEAKLKKMHDSLEKAKKLNKQYQDELVLQVSADEELEEARRQVEAETAQVIVCLQEELSALQQEVLDSNMKETGTRDRLTQVETQMTVMEESLRARTEENAELAAILEEKDRELKKMMEECDSIATEIEAILTGGHEAVEDTADQTDAGSDSATHNQCRISEPFERMRKYVFEKEVLIEELNRCLKDAVDGKNDMECMLRSLRGAALAMTETHQLECTEKENEIILLKSELDDKISTIKELQCLNQHGQDELKKASTCATAAFVIVNRLWELNATNQGSLHDKEVQIHELSEIIMDKDTTLQNQAPMIEEVNKKIDSLQMKLAASEEYCTKLRMELAEEHEQFEKNEESNILEAKERLKELHSGVSTLKSFMAAEHAKQHGDFETCVSTNDERELGTGSKPAKDLNETASWRSIGDVKMKDSIKNDINSVSESTTIEGANGRDADIILLKKEIECALGSLQFLQAETTTLQAEKEEILASEKCSRQGIRSLIKQAVFLQDSMVNFERTLELKVNAMDVKMNKLEEIVQESLDSWSHQTELLEDELDAAKVVASQKIIEASCVFEKFEEAQDTMKEADIMVNELLKANEDLKLSIQELKAKEKNLTREREQLAKEVESLKLSSELNEQNYVKLEKQYDTDLVSMKSMLSELEDVLSEFQITSCEEWKSISSDFLSVKSHVHNSTASIKAMLEEIWSEIIVKDCAVSVLHLCHMGILLETANGLNAENGLLHHGLCESSSVISELQGHNSRTCKELEMCRALKGKLLADIMKGFNQISSKVDEDGEMTLKLTSFEKKVQDLCVLEEAMLQRSNDMGSELSALMKELDISNKNAIASILDQERLLEQKDELLQLQEENFAVESSAKDFELLVLSSELRQKSLLKCDLENSYIATFESLKQDTVFKSIEADSMELILLDKESDLRTSHEKMHCLQNNACLQEKELCKLRAELEKKDEELERLSCIEKENGALQDRLNDSMIECPRLRENISVLENSIAKLEEDLNLASVKIESLEHSRAVVEDGLCSTTQDLQRKLDDMNSLKEENMLLRKQLGAHQVHEYEHLNALNSKLSRNVDLVENADVASCNTVNLIKEKITEVDNKFQKIVNEMGITDEILEQFEHLGSLAMQLESEVSSLRMELSRKDEVLKGLLFDLSLLQESASNSKDQKDEMEELTVSLRALEKDFELKSVELENAVADCRALEAKLHEQEERAASLESYRGKDHETIDSLTRKHAELLAAAEEAADARDSTAKELDEMTIKTKNLEAELCKMENALARMNAMTESLQSKLDAVASQRDELDGEVLALSEELEIVRARAEENESLVVEAQEAAEFQKVSAEEKEEEVKLLERSIEELECTINVLEQKVDIVKGDAERQRLQREELELELLNVKEQMQSVENNDSEMKRILDEKERNLQESLQRVQLLEKEIAARDLEMSQCKAHICELNLHAEAQANEYKQKFKALETMLEQVKYEAPAATSSSNKLERNGSNSKPRGSGSPFKCIGLGLAQQIKSEKDEELTAGRQRIEELEVLACSRQKEIFTLKARLAATESMTHDVIRDLLGVKLNMKNYANMIDNQQLQSLVEGNKQLNIEDEVKQQEIANLKLQINEFVKEKNGWLEEIERKQSELMAAHVALERLRHQDKLLATENEMLKVENANHKKRVMELEIEVKKLCGQQNIQQRIHHHAKIKEENNSLRRQNEDLSIKLRKTEAILGRVKDELAQFRAANGRNPCIDFDGEQQLDEKLKETEEERLQLAQKLLGLCTNVLKAAGITKPAATMSDISPAMAEEALEHLKNKVVALEMELEDVKLKNRISEERIRLSELRPQTSLLSPEMSSRGDDGDGDHRSLGRPSQAFLSELDR